jgi:hypothetical protein
MIKNLLNLNFYQKIIIDLNNLIDPKNFFLVVSFIFLIFSFISYFYELNSIILMTIIGISLTSTLVINFLCLIIKEGVLEPLAWFILGASIYFGISILSGIYSFNPYKVNYFLGDIYFLNKAVFINAISLFVIAITVKLFQIKNKKKRKLTLQDSIVPLNLLYLILISAIFFIVYKFYLYEHLNYSLIHNLVNKYQFVTPSVCLLFFLSLKNLNFISKLLGLIILSFLFILAILSLSKTNVLVLLIGCLLGYLIKCTSIKRLLISFVIFFTVFFLLNPYFTIARNHNLYNDLVHLGIDNDQSLKGFERSQKIHFDSIKYIFFNDEFDTSIKKPSFGMRQKYNNASIKSDSLTIVESLINRIFLRFDVIPTQSFIIDQYDQGYKANTISEFWTVFVPRTIWSEKPNLSRHGNNLFLLRFGRDDSTNSAEAPTFSAEAYWNYGFKGVILISFLYGLIICFLSAIYNKFKINKEIGYLFIAPSLIALLINIEGWIVGSIFGELIILMALCFGFNFFFKLFNKYVFNFKL